MSRGECPRPSSRWRGHPDTRALRGTCPCAGPLRGVALRPCPEPPLSWEVADVPGCPRTKKGMGPRLVPFLQQRAPAPHPPLPKAPRTGLPHREAATAPLPHRHPAQHPGRSPRRAGAQSRRGPRPSQLPEGPRPSPPDGGRATTSAPQPPRLRAAARPRRLPPAGGNPEVGSAGGSRRVAAARPAGRAQPDPAAGAAAAGMVLAAVRRACAARREPERSRDGDAAAARVSAVGWAGGEAAGLPEPPGRRRWSGAERGAVRCGALGWGRGSGPSRVAVR